MKRAVKVAVAIAGLLLVVATFERTAFASWTIPDAGAICLRSGSSWACETVSGGIPCHWHPIGIFSDGSEVGTCDDVDGFGLIDPPSGSGSGSWTVPSGGTTCAPMPESPWVCDPISGPLPVGWLKVDTYSDGSELWVGTSGFALKR